MKKDQFILDLRKIIREEVEMAVGAVMKEILSEQVTTQPKKRVVEEVQQVRKPKQQQRKQYVNNPILNDILNETSGFSNVNYEIDEEEEVQVPKKRSNTFQSNNNVQRPTIKESVQVPKVVQDIDGNNVSTDELPEELTTALTRDYSELMKAMFKKK